MIDETTPATPPQAGADIIDVTAQNFMQDVIEASRAQLVLVDFWAPWCEPCKQLTPLLERLAADGAFRLAKMNIDAEPAIAQQLRIQSVPTVFAFKDGQPVDAFAGALPESELRAFIEKHGGNEGARTAATDAQLAEAEALIASNPSTAAEGFMAVLAQEPENARALGGLAQCHIEAGEQDKAEALIDGLTPRLAATPEILAVKAAIDIARKTQSVDSDLQALQARLTKNDADHAARFDLALGLFANGQAEAAIDALLQIVAQERDWNDGAARAQLVEFFNLLGSEDALTIAARRRMSSILFS